MSECVFCRIVAGDVPSAGVVSTENVYAFEDAQPQAPLHVLVVPRAHIADAGEIGSCHGPLLAEMVVAAQAVADARGVATSGYRLVMNIGADAGNSVAHLHMHLLGGRPMSWPPG